MGEEARPAAVELAKAVADENDDVREWCNAALEELGPPAESAVPELVALLGDEHPDVAYWAATLLGRLEAQASAAVAALVAGLDSSRPLAVRQRCAWALGKIGSAEAIPALERAAADPDARLARLAQESIEQING